jgi:hypothetical protein
VDIPTLQRLRATSAQWIEGAFATQASDSYGQTATGEETRCSECCDQTFRFVIMQSSVVLIRGDGVDHL